MIRTINLIAFLIFISIYQLSAQNKVTKKPKVEVKKQTTNVEKVIPKPVENPDFEIINYAKSITSEDLRAHLSLLASDEYEGRETGKKGQKMAAEYISKVFNSLNIPEQAGGGYFQRYPVLESTIGKMEMKVNNTSYKFLEDYYLVQDFNSQKLSNNKILFAGFGISDSVYNDLEKINIKDKIVMVIKGEPKSKKGIYQLSRTVNPSENYQKSEKYKIEKLASLKPKVILIVNPEFDQTVKNYKKWIMEPKMDLEKDLETLNATVIYISPKLARELLGLTEKKFDAMVSKMNNQGKPQTKVSSSTLTYNFTKNRKSIETENVLGFVKGSKFPEEVIAITAHYDHIGVIDGKVYNGADDDGSGTSAVLELAQAFSKAKEDGKGPKRSILFMTVSGEEKGLLGSDYYTSNPVYPLENTVANLNIDMIGRVDEKHKENPNYVYLIGSDKLSTELHGISEMSNKKFGKMELDYTFNDPADPNRFYYRSDHYNFAKNNIPVIFYFNGVHEDYHKDTDEIDKINFDLMAKRTQLVFYTAWEIANRDSRLRVDLVNDFKEK